VHRLAYNRDVVAFSFEEAKAGALGTGEGWSLDPQQAKAGALI
jgi:hypothetical protein